VAKAGSQRVNDCRDPIEQLETRRLVDHAKRVQMRANRSSEAEAHRQIQKFERILAAEHS